MGPSNPSGDQPTVLIVDDQRETVDLYTDYLDDTYRVRTAHSGREAVEQMDSTIDVVLLDRHLPELSDHEVLDAIRAADGDCRIIMVTGSIPDLSIIVLPFDEYLVKPVSSEELHDAVERMLVRTTHDVKIQNIMSLASKMATLESKLELGDLKASDEYAVLEAELFDMREELGEETLEDDLYPEFTTRKIRSIIE